MSGVAPNSSGRTEAESTGTVPIAENLLSRVLEPYSYKRCRYLIDAQRAATADSVLAFANFRIDESAYIRNTGHFNAAELVLCFNQLVYSSLAQGVVNKDIFALRSWSIEDYYKNQLTNILIKSSLSRFKRPIDPQKFSARLLSRDFEIVERTCRYLLFSNTIEFWDENDGAATGEFEIAILNIP
jgi:FcoT-like thioesterase domain